MEMRDRAVQRDTLKIFREMRVHREMRKMRVRRWR